MSSPVLFPNRFPVLNSFCTEILKLQQKYSQNMCWIEAKQIFPFDVLMLIKLRLVN